MLFYTVTEYSTYSGALTLSELYIQAQSDLAFNMLPRRPKWAGTHVFKQFYFLFFPIAGTKQLGFQYAAAPP